MEMTGGWRAFCEWKSQSGLLMVFLQSLYAKGEELLSGEPGLYLSMGDDEPYYARQGKLCMDFASKFCRVGVEQQQLLKGNCMRWDCVFIYPKIFMRRGR